MHDGYARVTGAFMHITSRSLLLGGWLALSACDDSNKVEETVTGDIAGGSGSGDDGSDDGGDDGSDPQDADGDGFPASEDCDDTDDSVHPGAEELCDGVDNDCDGVTDPDDAADAPTFYRDADGDGFGDIDQPTTACEQPEDHVDNADDCYDTNDRVHPDATEICNELDDDCDALIDDDDDSLDTSSGAEFFLDADGDGYGDAALPTWACEQPDEHVDNADDCNDDSDAVWPGAPEVCDDLDNDCNGLTDDDDPAVDRSTARIFYRDADGDGYGRNNQTALGCSLPSGYSTDDTDCDDDNADVNPGATEVCDEDDTDEDCDRTWDDHDSSVDLSTGSTWYADADADGYGDSTDAGTLACDDPSTSTAPYVTEATDCDDTDADVNPGATEVCNSIDDDCDGDGDDDDSSLDTATAATWYVDDDGDGYGDADDAGTLACDDPSSATTDYVGEATDCDDADAAVNPGATEVCDASDTDEDCNGVADDDDTAVSGSSTWFPDDDGDTYGDSSHAGTDSCDDPSTATADWVSDNTDCDDGDAGVNPGATEVCDDDDTDEDCDGLADDDDSSVDSSTESAWYPDGDSDGYGDDSATGTSACDDPGTGSTTYVSDASDCDDADSAVNPGATEVCDASDTDEDCDGLADDDDSSVDTSTATRWYADDDGDSYGDSSDPGTLACDDPSTASSDYVTDDADCDDTDSAVNPAATEVCDSSDVDDDCDGLADNDDPSADTATTGSTFFPDDDQDGYGDASASGTDYCDDPSTAADWWTTDLTDCDDTDASVNPGATEVCNGVDDDCDSTTTEDGTASFVDSAGTTTDLSSSWGAGTSSSPATWTAGADGTLHICADTWYVHVEIDGYDVDLNGVDGSATTVLDGAGSGPVVSVSNATSTVSGLTIQNGSASLGGGMFVDTTTLTADDLVVTDNSATSDGGGIYTTASALDLSSLTIDGNAATNDGGGLMVDGGTTTTLDNVTITTNSAGAYGGGIMFDTTTGAQSITNSDISSNLASNYGGGIACSNASSPLTIEDSTFDSNTATFYFGGAMDLDECTASLDTVSLDSNASSRGGGINTNANLELVDVDLTNGTASWGGALYLALSSGESCTMSGGSVEDNTAAYYAGGVYASLSGTATFDVTSTDFSGNSPYSVRVVSVGNYTYGTSATFTCDSSGCM